MLRFLNPINWFRWPLQFFLAWFAAIRWRGALAAAPAAIVLLLMGTGTAIAWNSASSWRSRMVKKQLKDATQQEDYEVAELLLKRQIRNEPNDLNLRRTLAELLETKGDTEGATAQFRILADEEQDGIAAFWLLKNDFDLQDRPNWSEETKTAYGELTELVLKQYPDNVDARTLRTDFLLMQGRLEDAVPHMEFLARQQPERGIDLWKLYRRLGDESRAQDVADRTQKWLGELILTQPENLTARYFRAELLVYLDQHQDACNTLLQGMARVDLAKLKPEERERLRSSVAKSLVVYADHLRGQQQTAKVLAARLKLISRASSVYPAHPSVVRAISDTVVETASNKNQEIAQLREALLEGAEPGIVHFVQGTVAMLQGDSKKAAIELELAAKDLPQSSAILNNLAVAKLTVAKETGDLVSVDEALQLINTAIEQAEGQPDAARVLAYFQETRGQAYLLKEQWVDAIADFEAVLKNETLKRQAHEGLAEAYNGIEQPEMAELHASAAAKLVATQAAAEQRANEEATAGNALEAYSESLRSPEQPAADDDTSGGTEANNAAEGNQE